MTESTAILGSNPSSTIHYFVTWGKFISLSLRFLSNQDNDSSPICLGCCGADASIEKDLAQLPGTQ